MNFAPKLDLCNPRTVKAIARRCGLSPNRNFSQYFIVDRSIVDTLVETITVTSNSNILEIGPGIGTLTVELAQKFNQVIAVDLDPKCIRACQITLDGFDNVQLIERDILKLELDSLEWDGNFTVVGNLPYHLTGAILSYVLENKCAPEYAIFMLQKEVGERLSAPVGKWGLLTLAVRSLAKVEKIFDINPDVFEPPPKVYSSVIRLTPQIIMPDSERRSILDLAKIVFQMRRKTLRHALANALVGDQAMALTALQRSGIDSSRRPETLSLDDWRVLNGTVSSLSKAQ